MFTKQLVRDGDKTVDRYFKDAPTWFFFTRACLEQLGYCELWLCHSETLRSAALRSGH